MADARTTATPRRPKQPSAGAGASASDEVAALVPPVAHLESRQNLDNPWSNYFLWLEAYSWLYYVVLAVILSFSSISYLQNFWIGVWFAAQMLFPVSFVSVIFFAGPGVDMLKLQRTRYWYHAIYALVTGGLSIAACVAFMVLKIVYVASSECRADASSVCQGHLATFVFLMVLVAILVLIAALAVVTVAASCR